MADPLWVELTLDLDGSVRNERRNLGEDPELAALYADMTAAGYRFVLESGFRFVRDHDNRARLSIRKGDETLDDDFCRSWSPTVDQLMATMLKMELWAKRKVSDA